MTTPASKRPATVSSTPSLGFEAIASMSLLALQFGMQPVLTRKYTPATTCRSAVIITQECVKFVIATFMLSSSGQLKPALEGWTVSSWLTIAFLPAALYVVQNLCSLVAYQNLHPVTFNVLNQTKTVSYTQFSMH
jgi:UDP-sugar transporter A1/2/3